MAQSHRQRHHKRFCDMDEESFGKFMFYVNSLNRCQLLRLQCKVLTRLERYDAAPTASPDDVTVAELDLQELQ